MMVGISGTGRHGTLYNYYGCKGTLKKKCKRKYLPKDFIEDFVIEKAVSILTNENIEEIAAAVYEAAYKERDHSKIKQLQREILKLEKQKNNLLDSLKECELPEVRKSIFDEMQFMEKRKLELEKEIRLEENSQFHYTIPQIKAFLNNLRKKENRHNMRYRKMIVNSLIKRVFVYDKDVTIAFNTQDEELIAKMPNIKELESSFNLSEGSYKGTPSSP